MRLFEGLILLSELMYLAVGVILGRLQPDWAGIFPILAGFFLILHLHGEKARWQMAPIYIVAAGILFLPMLTGGPYYVNPAWYWVGLALLLIGSLLLIIAPVPSLPEPSGPYAIGTTIFDWVDHSRQEIYPPGEGKARRVQVQVWYPASPQPGVQHEPYLRGLENIIPIISRQVRAPGFLLSHLALAKTHAFTNAPAAEQQEKFPVLIFSHGWRGFRSQSTFQMEMLASHGYVVFAADHAYGAAAVAYPDGEVVLNYPQALPKNLSPQEYDIHARRLGQLWVSDIQFVLNQIARLECDEIPSPLAGRLDLAHTGILGHSTGGGAALETAMIDQRIQACLVMDAWLVPFTRDLLSEGVPQPTLFMHSQHWPIPRNPQMVETLQSNLSGDFYRLRLPKTFHESFSDVALFIPVIAALRVGRLSAMPTYQAINGYTLDFFDHYLKGQPLKLLNPGALPLDGAQVERKAAYD